MNVTLDLSSVLGTATLLVISVIGYFIRNIYLDFKKSKDAITELTIQVAKIQTLLQVNDKEIQRLIDKMLKIEEIRDDQAVLKRDQKTLWARFDALTRSTNEINGRGED